MESAERLASPSSLHVASSSSAGSSSPPPLAPPLPPAPPPPAPAQPPSSKCSLAPNPASLASPLTTCGQLFRTMSDQHFNMAAVSGAFPFSHPAFGLYTTACGSPSGRPEFGGLGSLGMSAALAAHSQLGAFPDWWRASEAHNRAAAAAFFPPLLGLPPLFAPPMPSHASGPPYQTRTPSKNGRATAKVVNGAVNGVGASGGIHGAFSAKGAADRSKAAANGRTGAPEDAIRAREKKTPAPRTEDKKCKKLTETSSLSGSQSGSSSDTSSDGVSSDSDDLEEEDDDDDEEDQSNDSEDSDSEKDGGVKTKIKVHGTAEGKRDGARAENSGPPPKQRRESPAPPHRGPRPPPQAPSPQGPPPPPPHPFALLLQSPRGREELQQHASVIHATGLAALSPGPAPHRSSLSSSTSSSSSSPKPPALSPSHKPAATGSRTSSPSKPLAPADGVLSGGRGFLDEALLHINSFRMQQPFLSQEHFKQAFPFQLKKQDSFKSQRKAAAAASCSSSLPLPPRLSPETTLGGLTPHANLFLSNPVLAHQHPLHPHPAHPQQQRPNGALIDAAVQDAPLALITKPRPHGQSAATPSFSAPVNLSTGAREAAAAVAAGVGPQAPRTGRKGKAAPRKSPAHAHPPPPPHPLADLVRASAESDIPSSKDSDDSLGDEDDEEDEDDEDDSLSESESNLDSDSDGSEDEAKERGDTDTDTEAERRPPKLTAAASKPPPPSNATTSSSSTSGLSTNCSPLNLQVIRTAGQPAPFAVTAMGAFAHLGVPPSSSSYTPGPPSGKRKRVTDERELRLPLEFGWQRETRIRSVASRVQGEVAYYAPCGKKLRQYPDVMKYITRNGITEITRDNFSFSTKIKVGDFYEAREGPQGLQWSLLAEDEVTPRIVAMDGRRGRQSNHDPQGSCDSPQARRRRERPPNAAAAEDSPAAADAKLLRRLEAQEMARQAAQMKMMRKLEKQAMARAAKEARRQQAIMAAEERKKQKEQMKILKQQEKIKRIQQIRMEKELRAQQILEAKRKKKEEAANAKILEAEKRIKEKEIRRQQAVIMKHQELERHRLDMERERRRQHMMLMKAMEARKKAEERERLKQEKKDEKRLNKERRLELRRLELEMAKELKKPNEDMCLADHKPLPELSRIPGLVLPGATFARCLTVVQFLRSFGRVLGLEAGGAGGPTLGALQEGLLNVGPGAAQLQDLLVRMLTTAVCDPGLPPGHRTKTTLGDHLTNVGIDRDNVSEVLQIFLEAHGEQQGAELTLLSSSLRTKAFQAHTPAQKAAALGFLVDELSCSKSVVSEIDKNIDHMTNLRKEKWFLEGNLRKLRTVHAKRTGKRDASTGAEDSQNLGTPTPGRKRKRRGGGGGGGGGGGDSEEDEDEDEDSEDQGDEDEEEEEEAAAAGGKKGKKMETCEEEDDGDHSASVEELEKQIDKLTKQQTQIRRKLFEASHSLRSMMFGQDRFKRRYWVLPQCGGIFVEAMESGEGREELERERERGRSGLELWVKQEQPEEEEEQEEEKPGAESTSLELTRDADRDTATPDSLPDSKDTLNLFLQKPGSFSKLSKLLEVAKMSPESDGHAHSHGSSPAKASPAVSASPAHPPPTTLPSSPSASSQPCPEGKAASGSSSLLGGPAPYLSPPGMTAPASPLRHPPPPPPPPQLLPNDQLLRVLTERSGHWFSLLPRSPCDDASVTSGDTPPPTASAGAASPQPAGAAAAPHGLSPAPLAGTFPLSALQQVKPGVSLMGLPFCGWPAGVLAAFPGSPLPPLLGAAYQHGEGGGHGNSNNPFLAPSGSTSKSESPAPPGESKPPPHHHHHPASSSSSTPSPAVDPARNQDHAGPLPVPEDMLHGWWKVCDADELRSLVKSLHGRGVREKALSKQIHKHMDYMTQACAKNRDVSVMDECGPEVRELLEEAVQSWSVEEQAMEVDIAALQQVEELERKVTSASLQVKGWMHPEPQSEREDLVYHEHKPFPGLGGPGGGVGRPGGQEHGGGAGPARRPDNPLDIAVSRLAELERNLERRYLKSPLGTTIQIRLDRAGTVTVPAPAPSCSGDGEGDEEELAPGMRTWRRALGEVSSAAQLALCVQQLHKSIAWERSIMKVYCQMCRKGDNEDLLLLCDGCDKGCHTYCQKPRISAIPDGDWFCPACIAKASGQSPKSKKQQSRPASGGGGGGGGKRGSLGEAKRSREASDDEAASTSSGGGTPKKGGKEARKRRVDDSPPGNPPRPDCALAACPVKKAKMVKDNNNSKDLNLCRVLLAELEGHQDAWPFLIPVNPKSVPGYKKVIRKPMDFSTIRDKLVNNQYLNLETFIIDVNLVFDNCEKFNEDNSDIGRAGHSMRRFFERRWPELLRQIS